MAQGKKEKKLARRERQQARREMSERVRERLLLAQLQPTQEAVEYVLPETAPDASAATAEEVAAEVHGTTVTPPPQPSKDDLGNEATAEDDDRVRLPAAPTVKVVASTPGRKHHRMTWAALKLAVLERYGRDAAELVEQHDGNATDPFFTVLLKTQPYTIPVPQHWTQLRRFLSTQADREEATGVVAAEIQALGVDKVRASRERKANVNQIAFMTCFLTGTPLQRRHFHVQLSRYGEVFYEGKWLPKTRFEPGQLSERLRQALGMSPHAPPPWLYTMQRMRRLPPAYPGLRIPGLNAPIPPGAQWGLGQGQWGEPPRGDDNAFLFPGVMDEAAVSRERDHGLAWGEVPTTRAGVDVDAPSTTTAPTPVPPSAAASRVTTTTTAPRVHITPVPFQPQSFTPAMARPVPTAPQEYVRVQDNSATATVAVGHVMVPKAAVAPDPKPRQGAS